MKTGIAAAAAAAFFVISTASHAEEAAASEAVAIAEDYIAAYSTFDMAKIEPFLSDDVVFSDPTSSDQNAAGGAFMFSGKEAVLEGLGDYAAQYASFGLRYDVERRYESEGVVVFVAKLTWTVETKDGRTASGAAPIVTAVTIADGKVARHLDLYDYKENAVEFPR